MNYGAREICDIVLKAKRRALIGSTWFDIGEPVIYLESGKTSSLDGTVATVYSQGGRNNGKLIGWDGDKSITLNFEDALISPLGMAILSGAGLIEANSEDAHLHVHQKLVDYGTVTTESIVVDASEVLKIDDTTFETVCTGYTTSIYGIVMNGSDVVARLGVGTYSATTHSFTFSNTTGIPQGGAEVLVDYYILKTSDAVQIEIGADSFSTPFYLEGSTLLRNEDGVDDPAEIVIPYAKIQSNFSFPMNGSGDPATFKFVIEAFPDYTRWNRKKKMLAAIQVISTTSTSAATEAELHTDVDPDIADA